MQTIAGRRLGNSGTKMEQLRHGRHAGKVAAGHLCIARGLFSATSCRHQTETKIKNKRAVSWYHDRLPRKAAIQRNGRWPENQRQTKE
jgi:hypothetical protein